MTITGLREIKNYLATLSEVNPLNKQEGNTDKSGNNKICVLHYVRPYPPNYFKAVLENPLLFNKEVYASSELLESKFDLKDKTTIVLEVTNAA